MAIKTFRHKGLAQYFLTGSKAGIQADHAKRLRLLLGHLDTAAHPLTLNAPGWGLHELQGARRGTWAVKVSGNWRLTFRFQGQDVIDVDYEDYH